MVQLFRPTPRHLEGALVLASLLVGCLISAWLPKVVRWGTGNAPSQAPVAVSAQTYRRLITLAPALTEIVLALEGKEQIVGVSDFCLLPTDEKSIRRCGGWVNPNLETIARLAPEVVLIQGEHQSVARFCQSRGIPLVPIAIERLGDIPMAIVRLGALTGKVDAAARLNARLTRELAHLAQRVQQRKAVRVFLSLNRMPGSLKSLWSVGGNNFLHELVEFAGGENICRDLGIPYPTVSAETLLVRAPEVILEFQPDVFPDESHWEKLQADWQPFSSLPAVRHRRIFLLAGANVLTPGPGCTRVAEQIANLLHPP